MSDEMPIEIKPFRIGIVLYYGVSIKIGFYNTINKEHFPPMWKHVLCFK